MGHTPCDRPPLPTYRLRALRSFVSFYGDIRTENLLALSEEDDTTRTPSSARLATGSP